MLASARPLDLEAAVVELVDPGRATETIHWGRNYLYRQQLPTESGAVDVVVKQFRNQGWKARLRRRFEGSKAEKSWRVARYCVEHGVATAEPLLLIESRDPEGPSLFVSRRIADCFESRYFFRALERGLAQEEFPQLSVEDLLTALALFLRGMHDAGIWHRDVSVGNLLVCPREGRLPEVAIVDLNRARVGPVPTTVERVRDLCRLRIFDPAHQRCFLEAYWDDGESGWKRFLYSLYSNAFLWRNETKRWLRSPFSGFAPRRPHAHIPAAPEQAGARDRSVWDHLSDQPHQHAGRWQRLGVRLADSGAHLRELAVCAAALPRIAGRYRRLRNGGGPVVLASAADPGARETSEVGLDGIGLDGIGLALRPWPADPDGLLRELEALGVRKLLLRLHPWQNEHDDEEALARELAGRGYDLVYSLPQNRELVKDLGRWRASLDELAARFTPYGSTFQVGQAVNRSKWGVWRYDEYERLLMAARDAFEPYDAQLFGPAVIDFEFYATASLLNARWREGLALDGVASLLYVDRRGAPENRQLGLDTIGKVTLLRAIADTARNAAGENWITEFNWPLWEGPHSPAGRKVSVDEERQADYLVRFYVQALASGMVERAYWWQLIARGYGLVVQEADGSLRRRPAFEALSTLCERLGGGRLRHRRVTAEGVWWYGFDVGGEERWVGWSTGGHRQAEVPIGIGTANARDGAAIEALSGLEEGTPVTVGDSPIYLR